MARVSEAALIGLLLSFGACTSSKVLNESRAKALIEEALKNNSYMISAQPIVPLMSRTWQDYTLGSFSAEEEARENSSPTLPVFMINRLIEEKLVTKKSEILNYPVVSGVFVLYVQDQSGGRLETTDVKININMNSRTNNLYGRRVRIITTKGGGGSGTSTETDDFTGTVDPNGRVYLTLPRYTNGFRDGEGLEFIYREDGKTAYLQQLDDKKNRIFTGTASEKRVEAKWYDYTFSPEVQQSVGDRGIKVAAGQFKVGEVSDLQLVYETRAVARFAWQAELNRLGHIMLGAANPSGKGTAEFAKKPDGTWVLVNTKTGTADR